jgi:GNAT superfamily N-acetyltransferase
MQVTITRKLLEHLRTDAAAIYYEAFRRKLGPLLGAEAKAKAALAADFDLTCVIAALEGDKLLGIAALQHSGKSFTNLRFGTMRRHYGFFEGSFRLALMTVFENYNRHSGLYIEAIAVAPDARGKGIGTLLLNTVTEYAREKGYSHLTLEVVNTNPDARRLYEREGFKVVKTSEYGMFTQGLGFTGSVEMMKPV